MKFRFERYYPCIGYFILEGALDAVGIGDEDFDFVAFESRCGVSKQSGCWLFPTISSFMGDSLMMIFMRTCRRVRTGNSTLLSVEAAWVTKVMSLSRSTVIF